MATTTDMPAIVPTRPKHRGGTFWLAINVAALAGVALFLRTWHLGNIPGINGDEAWSGVQAVRLVHGEAIAWRTPTGNPVNVFFLLPLAALHAVFPPSFVLLRSVALASGVAALVANYWLCRRVFDLPTAIVSTLLLAVLPINVAYSRFAWDASQSLLATLPVLYLPLWVLRGSRRPRLLSVAAVMALLAAVWVHPTNVFAAPLVVVPLMYARRVDARSAPRRHGFRPAGGTHRVGRFRHDGRVSRLERGEGSSRAGPVEPFSAELPAIVLRRDRV